MLLRTIAGMHAGEDEDYSPHAADVALRMQRAVRLVDSFVPDPNTETLTDVTTDVTAPMKRRRGRPPKARP